MVRVNINEVSIGELQSYKIIDGKSQAQNIDKNAEAFSHKNKKFINICGDYLSMNPLIASVYVAFANHIPLEFSPDLIFNIILQGISEHVAKSPETYRDSFVNHKGKKQLETINNSLVRGDWNNNWESSIFDLKDQILASMSMDYTKKLINSRFSTTTIAESTAHIAVFMDIVKYYFEYKMTTMCGIPWIEITGTREDWVNLRESIKPLLLALKLEDWNNDLQEILTQFINVFDGLKDFQFWNQIYNYYGPAGSGSNKTVSGWITKLFLYVQGHKNPAINKNNVKIEPCDFNKGLTKTSFIWNYLGTQIPMNLIAGNIGVSITSSGALKPEIGWLIAEDKPEIILTNSSSSISKVNDTNYMNNSINDIKRSNWPWNIQGIS